MPQTDSPQFTQAFTTLNSAQKQAVETIYGPVLVIAGPGTGKTQVLAMRIANILQKTDVHPRNILALTFTESGAVAMRKRLLTLIGPTAHSVTIATFHGFCQEIISEFPEKFIFARRLEAIDDLQRLQILKNILESEKLELLRPLRNPTFFLKEIQGLLSTLKRENISPEKFLKLCQEEEKEFADVPETEKINPKTGKVKMKFADQEKQIAKHFELHRIYSAYQKELEREGFYDFEDMIGFVLEQLKTDEDLLWTLRERFQFLLTDEFQDTNGLQMSILTLLAGEDEAPNIFAVGDDDQSIYRFQGASLENILSFEERFLKSTILCLTENYRSTQSILDISQAVIDQNLERLTKKIPTLEKNLKAVLRKEMQLPEIHTFAQVENEHFFLVKTIRELHERKSIPYAEIGVLVRNNSDGFELLKFFEAENLPASFSGQGNALKSRMVRMILNLFRLIADPEDDALFFESLHANFFQIPIALIWELWDEIKHEMSGDRGKFWKYWRTVQKNEQIDEKFKIFCEHLERWQYALKNLSLPEFCQKVLTESGILDALLLTSSLDHNIKEGDTAPCRLQNNSQIPESATAGSRLQGQDQGIPSLQNFEDINHINALFSEMERFARGNTKGTLADFLETIALREEFTLPLPERDIHATSDAVQILTAHKSKGLEFEVVFVAHAQSGKWGDTKNRSKLKLPEGILKFSNEHDENEDERRLFFVACTRAKSQLFFTFSETDARGSERTESRFVSEIPEVLVQRLPKEEISGPTAFEILRSKLTARPQKENTFPLEFLRKAVAPENFALSHSAFENFRENPQKFLWQNILQIPEPKAPAAILGTALHKALEEFLRLIPEENPKAAEEIFLTSIRHEALTETERADLEREGMECLQKYFANYSGNFVPAYRTEFNFRSHHVMLDGEIPLTGKIDKLEWISENAKTVRVVDYKSTVPKSENEIRGSRDSDSGDITAGRYFRQLTFYSLLCDLSPKFPEKAEIFTIDFLMPSPAGGFKKLDFQITPEEKEALKQEIRLAWKKIQNLEFAPVNLWGEEAGGEVFDFLIDTEE